MAGRRPVVAVVFIVHRATGRPLRVDVAMHPPVMYERLVADVALVNRALRLSRR